MTLFSTRENQRLYRHNGIYVLDMFYVDNCLRRCFFSHGQSHLNWLSNKRLYHLNFKKISKITWNQLVRGLPKIQCVTDKLCSACENWKKTNSSFKPNSCSSIIKPLHLLHWDLFGLVPSNSRFGKKYTLIIFNQLSRFAQVVF